MSDRQFERAVSDWLEDGSDRTPGSAIDGVLLAVRTTPQERDLRIPWRIHMPVYARAALIAVALVVMVGAGLAFLNTGAPGGAGGAPAPTASPSASPSPSARPSEVAPGISGWTPFTSKVYGYTLSYPSGWDATSATREWQPSDGPGHEETADTFVRPDNDIGISMGLAPAGAGADIQSVAGLKAWAKGYCTDVRLQGCDTFTDRTEPLCLNAGGDPCRAAILVRSTGTTPDDAAEYAFFPNWPSVMLTGAPDKVTVVGVGRGDAYAGAAQYGGAVQLLKSVLSTMGVTSP